MQRLRYKIRPYREDSDGVTMNKWLTVVICFAFLTGSLSAQQETKTSAGNLLTPWGDPDLRGIWTNTTSTPFERPSEFGEREFLTDEEFAQKQ